MSPARRLVTLVGSLVAVVILSAQTAASEPAVPSADGGTLHQRARTLPRGGIGRPPNGPQRPVQPRSAGPGNLTVTVRVVPAPVTITRFSLEQNFPNPFTASTTIQFAVPNRTSCSISVYSVTGQKIATLVNWGYDPGAYSIQWNGTDDRGRRLHAGVYFYRAVAGPLMLTRKLIIE
ncbi:MAG: T9SS type A sorting domain-containing protein [Candidatus Eisenbacteria bacterium]|nr:T9SS type A sorting domain-containing protein [Candidatus Eisenbacteria bacterium]